MSQQKNKLSICYFGIYDQNLARNKNYISCLKKAGFEVLQCNDHGVGFRKYVYLFLKHWKIRKQYDIMLVGFPGHVIMPFAKLICRKKIIFDAFFTVYEAEIISRKKYNKTNWRYWYIKIIDYIAVKFASYILVETKQQQNFFINKFKIDSSKISSLYTGVDEEIFKFKQIDKFEKYTVLFRGRLMPEAGVAHLLKAAKLLEQEEINFLIIGFGFMEKEIKETIDRLCLNNVKLISRHIESAELVEYMLKSHVSLGQFENNERLDRTIPHKAFESLALKLPYITGRAKGAEELFTDNLNCLMVELGDAQDLADKIMILKNDRTISDNIAHNGYELYKEIFSSEVIGKELTKLIYEVYEKN